MNRIFGSVVKGFVLLLGYKKLSTPLYQVSFLTVRQDYEAGEVCSPSTKPWTLTNLHSHWFGVICLIANMVKVMH